MTSKCTDVLVRMFAALDSNDYEGVVQFFGADGVWHRQGRILSGPGEIGRALEQRPPGMATAHLVSNVMAIGRTQPATEFAFYLTVLRSLVGGTSGQVAPDLPSTVVISGRLTFGPPVGRRPAIRWLDTSRYVVKAGSLGGNLLQLS